MPSTQVWNGAAADGNFGTAGNWVSGVAPIGGDSVVFNNGAIAVTAGLTTGISIVKMTVTANYGGTIGTAASPLTFTAITSSLDYAGTGSFFYVGCSGTVANGNFNHSGGATVAVATGTWTTLLNGTGTIDVAAAVVLASGAGSVGNAGGTMTIAYNATAIFAFIGHGKITCRRVITTGDVEGGTLTSQDNGTTNYISNGTIVVHNGATYNKQSGVVDTLVDVRYRGYLTFAGCSGGATPGTALTPAVTLWAGGRVNVLSPGVVVTPTYTIKGMAGGGASDGGG